jgi:hypothetical protein
MGEKPKKDKDRLIRQKKLHPKNDKLNENHLKEVSGAHSKTHDRIYSYTHQSYEQKGD